jgi:pyridoxine 4-dehydrogenase
MVARMNEPFLLGGDLPVSRLGFGAMRLCGQPGNFGPYPDWQGGERLLRRAVELGVQLIDTAEAYGPGHNEELIASALYPYAPGLVIATKGGVTKTSPTAIVPDGRPETLRRSCEASLRRLRLDRIDLYQLHRPDPRVPFEESLGALGALQAEGKIRHIGLSNVSLEQLEQARALLPIVSVQNRYNVLDRAGEDVLQACIAHNIAFLPYSPLGASPFEKHAPLTDPAGSLAGVAAKAGATHGQAALAWLLARACNILVIPGTTSVAHLEENVAAGALQLGPEAFTTL